MTDFLRKWVGDDCFCLIIEYSCLYGFANYMSKQLFKCFIFDPEDKTFKYLYLNVFSKEKNAYVDFPNIHNKPYIVFHIDYNWSTYFFSLDKTIENNNLVPLTENCNEFILNFEKEKADNEEEKKRDEKTMLENIDLKNLKFIQKCSNSECSFCEEQTEKKYVCTECKYEEAMCVKCLESLIRNRYHMSGGDTYISCMSCKTKLEF